MANYETLINEMVELLLGDDPDAPVAWAQEVLDGDIEATDFFNDVFTPAMTSIGDKFGRLDIFLPELIDSAERAQAISKEVLEPIFAAEGGDTQMSRGKIVLCTVQGDLHDIGKNMVGMMLEGAGFQVIDLGINVSVEKFVEAVREEQADILGMSALLSTTMPHLQTTLEGLKAHGLRDQIQVLVGGAPVTEDYAMQIGADGYAPDAARAVDKAKELLKIQNSGP